MAIWRKKSNIFKTTIDQIVWKVEKIQKAKAQKLWRQKNKRIILLSNCADCNSKISILMKEQEASGLLGSFGIKTHFIRIPLVGPLYWRGLTSRFSGINKLIQDIKWIKW